MKDMIKELVSNYQADVLEYFHYFHSHAELSFAEYETSAYIREKLKQFGISLMPGVRGTSTVGILDSGVPGPVIAFRADIDALPIQEKTELDYKSCHEGVMHACGHDSHTAVLLALAKLMSEHKDLLHGKVKFIFQAAEEKIPGGAITLCEDGVMEDVDSIYAFHSSSMLPTGLIATNTGAGSACVGTYEIHIQGKSGHICMPEETINPLPIACSIATTLNQVLANRVNPMERALLSVTTLHCGEKDNIISDKAVIGGNIRTFDDELMKKLFDHVEQICNGICSAYGTTYHIEKEIGYPVVWNHEKECDIVNRAADLLGYPREVSNTAMNGEDFSYYLKEKPGIIFYIGMGNPDKSNGWHPHHNSKFQLDEDALQVALAMELAIYLLSR